MDETKPQAAPPTCDSCGAPDDRLEPVRRVYLDVDDVGGVRELATLDDDEWWCPACRASYPHKPVPDPPGRADGDPTSPGAGR